MSFLDRCIHSFIGSQEYKLYSIQQLWAGYGCIYRLDTTGKQYVVKHYQWRDAAVLNSDKDSFAEKRKITSFLHEKDWYSSNLGQKLGIIQPQCLFSKSENQELVLILSDLENEGFICSNRSINVQEYEQTIIFLAEMHARGVDLWDMKMPLAGYWQLALRPFELQEMAPSILKTKAKQISSLLDGAKFQCVLHGDAKAANYGVNPDNGAVAAFDFQYWGRGPGIMDLVCYLSGVASSEAEWNNYSAIYFDQLKHQLANRHFGEMDLLIEEWRFLLPFARADYQRFIEGWSPTHWKSNALPKPVLGLLEAL